jgi:8-oxo-dGTP pyrophosphatase MutT (NUDIX family)
MKREFSAGGVVFKKVEEEGRHTKILWLVAKNKANKDYPDEIWRLPKGWLDDSNGGKKPGPMASGVKRASTDQIIETAVREVLEEGGVEVKVVKKIATDNYFYTDKEKNKVSKFVTYFLMEWIQDFKDGFGEETEEVKWMEHDKAKEKLSYQREKNVLESAKAVLDTGVQGNLI